MEFTKRIKELLATKSPKNNLKKIGFIEGWSKRTIRAAARLKAMGLLEPIMLFPTRKTYGEANLPRNLKYLIIEDEKALLSQLVAAYAKKRSGKETVAQASAALSTTPYFGAMLVNNAFLDGAVGGVEHASSEILRCGFRALSPKLGIKTISSAMIMHKDEAAYIYSDISVNIEPTTNQLVEIARNACAFARLIDIEPKVAFLSFSTAGSAVAPQATKIKNATDEFKRLEKNKFQTIGEIQFDAAYNETIRLKKYPPKAFPGAASIFIFPDLNSGNIGYKIAQQMGGWGAIGPVLTGINKPFNDLSRGATIADIEHTAILTALQAFSATD